MSYGRPLPQGFQADEPPECLECTDMEYPEAR